MAGLRACDRRNFLDPVTSAPVLRLHRRHQLRFLKFIHTCRYVPLPLWIVIGQWALRCYPAFHPGWDTCILSKSFSLEKSKASAMIQFRIRANLVSIKGSSLETLNLLPVCFRLKPALRRKK